MEVRGGVSGAVTIMEFWTMEIYDVGILICIAVVLVRSVLGDDKGEG